LITSGSNAGNLKGTFAFWAPYASGVDREGRALYVEDAKTAVGSAGSSAISRKTSPSPFFGAIGTAITKTSSATTRWGRPAIGDDVLILADSYDTSDH
jgi:hypothetical protein